MHLIRRAWMKGILLVKCFGWQLCGDRYWCSSVGLLYMSNTIFTGIVSIQMLVLDVLWVNFIVRWTLLAWSKKQWRFSFESVHFMSMSCMKRDQENGFCGEDCIICFSSFPMKILAYEGAIVVPIAVLLICIICSPLSVKCNQYQCEQLDKTFRWWFFNALWSQAIQHRHYVGC